MTHLRKPILVSPAGNLDKLRFAIRYGANAVYFGGEMFNLRAGSENLSIENIARGTEICTTANVDSIFLMNSFLHQSDIEKVKEYLSLIKDFNFSAILISDPGMMMIIRELGISTPIHLSTQMSTLNHYAINFWKDVGISRIVLAREVTLEEIRRIREHVDIELEVFVHGALCISYSGRCLLSRYFTGRDANLGQCTHPCRWKYSIVEENREGNHLDIIEYARGTEILSSKDLCLIRLLPEYARAGVDAFKIEGRMKSVYYTANTTRVYAHALSLLDKPEEFAAKLPFWQRELALISHRPYTENLFNEFEGMKGKKSIPTIRGARFFGYFVEKGRDETEIYMMVHNPFSLGDTVEAIYPIYNNCVRDKQYRVCDIAEGELIATSAIPNRIYRVRFDAPVYEYAIFRESTK
ncbi:MAG: U32 family peptidase [Spirochaetes bacterium]|nr:U32 family peptidase [Spirochaetota bacterium]